MGVFLINRNEPETRRSFHLAHELFYALRKPDAMRVSACKELAPLHFKVDTLPPA